jgi:hypothetical protein
MVMQPEGILEDNVKCHNIVASCCTSLMHVTGSSVLLQLAVIKNTTQHDKKGPSAWDTLAHMQGGVGPRVKEIRATITEAQQF